MSTNTLYYIIILGIILGSVGCYRALHNDSAQGYRESFTLTCMGIHTEAAMEIDYIWALYSLVSYLHHRISVRC